MTAPEAVPGRAFYFDLASPLAYFAAERVLHVLPGPLPWIPIHAARLSHAESFETFRCQNEHDIFFAETERRAYDLGLQAFRWPQPFPFDSELAMCAATYAQSIGRAVPFAQAAFRQAFAGGRDLSDPDSIAIAGAACEIHPRALLTAARGTRTREQLARATQQALEQGVTDVPAIRIADRVFIGERSLARAAELVAAAR